MAITTLELIYEALQELGARTPSDTTALNSTEQTSYLTRLNSMIDEWKLKKVIVPVMTQETFPLVSGQASYTIGTGGNFNTPRPIAIVGQPFIRYPNSIDIPLRPISRSEYMAIGLKSAPGIPDRIYYDPQYPNGIINIYPVINVSGYSLYIDEFKTNTAITDVTQPLPVPPEYVNVLRLGLACALARPVTLQAPPPDMVKEFDDAFRLAAMIGWDAGVLTTDEALLPTGPFNIIRGY